MNKKVSIILMLASLILAAEDDCTQRHGGSFYFTPGFMNMDLNPIKEQAKNDRALNSYTFDLSDQIFALQGFGFFWGEKNRGRGGLSFQAGYRRYRSDVSSLVLRSDKGDTLFDSTHAPYMGDSVMNLMVIPAYAMFHFDRSRSFGSVNLYGGGAIGSGALILIRSGEEGSESTAFAEDPFVSQNGESKFDEPDGNVGMAFLLVMELHAGSTISMNKWLHVGLEGFMFGQYANNGFEKAERGSFSQFLPGIRMRIIFGSLG